MMTLSKRNYDLSFLSSEFENVNFEIYSSDQLQFINCITCWFDSPEELIKSWKALQSIISVKFKPEVRFARWNIYLAMLCAAPLDVREKYAIENDRYAARKIVLDGLGELPPAEKIEEMINVELLGTDLKLQTMPQPTSAVKLSIAPLIKNAPLDSTSKSKERRGEIVSRLIEHYRQNENKES